MKNINRNMLHMKLNSAVSTFAVAAAFAVFLPPSNASAGVCFLPDCQDDEVVQGDINMNINSDTEYCEEKGYTYYSSGECPQYQAKVGTCSRDDHYLKCDAVTWCKNNGYNTQTCSLPSFVDGQCPNGKPYYKGCKEDRPRACREQGYVNSCSPGRLYKSTNRCPWDSSYGKCCTASPSAGCPTDYKVTCDPSRGSSGTDTCGYTCYRCCDDTCPSGTSKNYTGSYSTTTECGSRCNRCKTCPSGSSTSYTGSYAGTTECNGGQSCYKCNDTCRTGEKSVSCSSTYKKVRVSTTECGNSCYECQYNTDCSVTSKSCTYGCASTNSCNKCISCKTHSHSYSCPSGYQSSSCGSGYTTSGTTSRSCSCGVTSGTCYKCTKNTNNTGGSGGGGSSYSRTSISTVWDHGACFLKCNYTGGKYHISRDCWSRQDWCDSAKSSPNSSGRCPSSMSSFKHSYDCGYFKRQSITTVWNNNWCFLKCTYKDTYDGEIVTHISRTCWSRQDWCDDAKSSPESENRCPTNMTYDKFKSSYTCY